MYAVEYWDSLDQSWVRLKSFWFRRRALSHMTRAVKNYDFVTTWRAVHDRIVICFATRSHAILSSSELKAAVSKQNYLPPRND